MILKKPSSPPAGRRVPAPSPVLVFSLTPAACQSAAPPRERRGLSWSRGAPRRPADEARDRQPHLHRRRRRAARRRRRAHRRGRLRPLADRVRRPAPLLRRAAGQRPRLVALDLPGRLRARAVRAGVLPTPPQGPRRAGLDVCTMPRRRRGPPPTRWALAGSPAQGYGEHFARLVADGEDIDGEARLADALAPRGARILDVGSGMGRVADALRRARPRGRRHGARPEPAGPVARDVPRPGGAAARGTRPRPRRARPLRPGRRRRQRDGLPRRGHRAGGADPAARAARARVAACWRASTSPR